MRPPLAFLVALIALIALVPAGRAQARGPGAPALDRTREAIPAPVSGARAASSPTAPTATLPASTVKGVLRGAMRSAGSGSGAAVVDLTGGKGLYRTRSGTQRAPASVEKLYTTSTALLRYGPDAALQTTVVGAGQLAGTTWQGDLYLRGSGDPTFGSQSFTRRTYGTGATTYELAQKLADAGIQRVEGSIFGDDSAWDRFRGVPDSGLSNVSPYVGSLSALAYDRGGSAAYAASQLKVALKGRGIAVTGSTSAGVAPAGASELTASASPPIRTLVKLTLTPSDNFFAEMLIKGLGARFGSGGSTAAGASVVRSAVGRFGVSPQVVDGSGLSRADRTSPSELVRLLDRIRSQPAVAEALRAGLPVAGRSGTLVTRMRGTAAQGRCQAKTGTLSNVSGLAGYCDTQGGRLVAFAFLMNGVNVSGARALQDRMVTAIARYAG